MEPQPGAGGDRPEPSLNPEPAGRRSRVFLAIFHNSVQEDSMRKRGLVMLGVLALAAVAATLLWAAPAYASKLSEALAKTPQGAGPGMIQPGAPQGFMGIPGAPHHFFLFYILWGIWV